MAREIETLRRQIAAGALQVQVYPASGLPNAADYYNSTASFGKLGVIAVKNDATVGVTLAWSDGANWKRPNAVGTVS